MEKLTKEDWESYKKQIEQSLKVNQMAVWTDKNLLRSVNQKIESCPIEIMSEEEIRNTESAKSAEKMVA